MSTIMVEGLGRVEIAGEKPTEAEKFDIIMKLLESDAQLGTSRNPGEIRSISKEEFDKARMRERVEGLPGVAQFLTEAAPVTSTSAVGGIIGAPAGPVGVAVGTGLGGLFGEMMSQEAGITPESAGNKQLAAASPIAGTAVGGTLRLGRRISGAVTRMMPPVKAALGRLTQREAVDEFESLGAKVIARKTGFMSRTASDLYESATRTGATVPARELRNTSRALAELDKELGIIADFPEGRQALALIDQAIATLGGDTPINFSTFVITRQLIGTALQRAEAASGVRLGTAKRLFKAMSDDIDTIARGTTKARRPAAVAQAAAKRAKLEFSVSEFEEAVARFTTDIPGEAGVSQLNIKGLQKWFRDVTNEKSTKFNNNFSTALEEEIPGIRTHLSDLAKLTEQLNPAGPGSIVVRGVGAGIGGTIGFVTLAPLGMGPLGAGAGALAGASLPEVMTALLTSPVGARALKRAVRLGKLDLNAQKWAALGQMVNQLSGIGDREPTAKLRTISDLQRQAMAAAGLEF